MRGKGQNDSVIKLVNKVMLHLIFVKCAGKMSRNEPIKKIYIFILHLKYLQNDKTKK